MTRKKKKPTVSRTEQYRRQQRKSWGRFLGKGLLFFLPVLILTAWMVYTFLKSDKSLPILVLGDEQAVGSDPDTQAWKTSTYRKEIPEGVSFGGRNKDTLVIFNDLLGSVKPFNAEGKPDAQGKSTPCVFVANRPEQNETAAFLGLRSGDIETTNDQWKPLRDYLKGTLKQISDSAGTSGHKRRIIFALDVAHPDLPGRLPPQTNQFMRLAFDAWSSGDDSTQSIRDELRDDFSSFDVFIWMSHSPGQMSYYSSDPAKVGSFFKRRLELAMTSRPSSDIDNDGNNVTYKEMRQYVLDNVSSDAEDHLLVQQPMFLEPAGFDSDSPISLQWNSEPKKDNGAVFNYRQRKEEDAPQELWSKFEWVKRKHGWELEDPLRVQQCTMLLLQMDRLWYLGKAHTQLFDDLAAQFDEVCDNPSSLAPVMHTLHDRLSRAKRDGENIKRDGENIIFDFDLAYLTNFDATNQADLGKIDGEQSSPKTIPPDAKTDSDSLTDQLKKDRDEWLKEHQGWQCSMAIWRALVDITADSTIEESIDKVAFSEAIKLLTDRGGRQNPDTKAAWNEVGYLIRLATELTWPDQPKNAGSDTGIQRKFAGLVLQSLRVRDQCNQFVAELSPVMTDRFREEFEEIENDRRYCEDRLFAYDHLELAGDFQRLLRSLQNLFDRRQTAQKNLANTQSRLIAEPHELRYAIQSLANFSKINNDSVKQILSVLRAERSGSAQSKAPPSGTRDDDQTSKWAGDKIVLETLFDRSGSKTGCATDPATDFERFKKINQTDEASHAPGNLIFRRMLGLANRDFTADTSSKLYGDLASEKVDVVNTERDSSGGNFSTLKTQAEASEKMLAQFAALGEHFPSRPPNDDSAPKDEKEFVRLAAQAHQIVPLDLDAKETLAQVKQVNQLRLKKSDLVFTRVANDLWATPRPNEANNFVVQSLAGHEATIRDRLDAYVKESKNLQIVKDHVSDVWLDQNQALPDWDKRAKSAVDFSTSFNSWSWREEDAANPQLVKFFRNFESSEERMQFAMSSESVKTTFAAPELQQTAGSMHVVLDPRELGALFGNGKIYLRGHSFENLRGNIRDSGQKTAVVKLETYLSNGPQIVIKRDGGQELVGRISIIIDCSRSMRARNGGPKSGKMAKTQEAVLSLLDLIAERSNLAVELFAIGAADFYDKPKSGRAAMPRYLEQGKNDWRRYTRGEDVWRFGSDASAKRITRNNVDALKTAVKLLEAHGETPLISGLDRVIRETADRLPQLTLLVTDGFEFVIRNEAEPGGLAKWRFQSIDNKRYRRVESKLENGKTRLAIFNLFRGETDFKDQVGSNGLTANSIRQLSLIHI